MKAWLFIAVIFAVLYNANVEAGNPLKKIIKKIDKLVSTFITSDQITKLANGAVSDYLAGKSLTDIGNNAFNTGMQLLTTSQKTQGLALLSGLITDLGGPAQANVTLNKVIPPVMKIITPLANKLQSQIQSGQSQGQSTDQLTTTIYKFVNKKFTKKKATQVANAAWNVLSDSEKSAVYNNGKTVVKFEVYGFSA